jgi:hypothetical protein
MPLASISFASRRNSELGADCEECNKHREELVRLATQYENKVAVGVLDTKKDADVARVFGIDVAPAVIFSSQACTARAKMLADDCQSPTLSHAARRRL